MHEGSNIVDSALEHKPVNTPGRLRTVIQVDQVLLIGICAQPTSRDLGSGLNVIH
jgi:hypothetical protein